VGIYHYIYNTPKTKQDEILPNSSFSTNISLERGTIFSLFKRKNRGKISYTHFSQIIYHKHRVLHFFLIQFLGASYQMKPQFL